jgi:hypothetical protein
MVAPLVLRNMPMTTPNLLSGRWLLGAGVFGAERFEACFLGGRAATLVAVLPFLAPGADFASLVGRFMIVSVGKRRRHAVTTASPDER